MSNPNSTDKPEAKPALTGSADSASWSKAEMHFGIAKAAWKLAAKNEHGAAMVIEHMERAIETLKTLKASHENRDATSVA